MGAQQNFCDCCLIFVPVFHTYPYSVRCECRSPRILPYNLDYTIVLLRLASSQCHSRTWGSSRVRRFILYSGEDPVLHRAACHVDIPDIPVFNPGVKPRLLPVTIHQMRRSFPLFTLPPVGVWGDGGGWW